MNDFRTDLAIEAFDGQGDSTLPGVDISRWETCGITLTEVVVSDDEAARMLGKPIGRYLTMTCPQLVRRDPEARQALEGLLSEELWRMLPSCGEADCALVIGLGNRQITPDALGPAVVDRTLVTRHIANRPEGYPAFRPVSAVAPGVLGVTGIETMDVAEQLVRLVRPAVVICVDSLAARDSARIGTTLQLTDTGIQPGAGVGNHRRALNQEALGVPVIAIGMPMVIYAAALARDAIGWLNRQDGEPDGAEAALEAIEQRLRSADLGSLIVTPREIDALIEDSAGIIAMAINRALQPGLSRQEIEIMIS